MPRLDRSQTNYGSNISPIRDLGVSLGLSKVFGAISRSVLFAYSAYAVCLIVVYGGIGTITDIAIRMRCVGLSTTVNQPTENGG